MAKTAKYCLLAVGIQEVLGEISEQYGLFGSRYEEISGNYFAKMIEKKERENRSIKF